MKKINITPKARRWILLVGVSLSLFSALWLYFMVTDTSKTPKAAPTNTSIGGATATNPNTKSVMSPGSQVAPADQWLATAGTEVSKVSDRMTKTEQQIQSMNETQKRFEAELLPKLNALLEKQVSQNLPLPDANAVGRTPVNPSAIYPPQDALPRRNAPIRAPSGLIGAPPLSTEVDPVVSRSIGLIRLSTLRDEASNLNQSGNQVSSTAGSSTVSSSAAKRRTVENYLPISFTPAILLGGLDAPTGGQSQTNPHPVLMRLETNANLPNRFRSGVKECLVIGSGYGDISSERCYIRTERLSCVKQDGTVLETELNGSVFGEDGKIGMRGRLVEKQGQILANALLAGGIGGISKGLQSRSSIVTSTPLGSTSSIAGGKEFEAGIGAGIGGAMDRLAQYYISVAEKVFPIVECDAGRKIDVVVTKGIRLEDDALAPVTGASATIVGQGQSALRFPTASSASAQPVRSNDE
jgi:conjugal transfer pilus assembly protein TraB